MGVVYIGLLMVFEHLYFDFIALCELLYETFGLSVGLMSFDCMEIWQMN